MLFDHVSPVLAFTVAGILGLLAVLPAMKRPLRRYDSGPHEIQGAPYANGAWLRESSSSAFSRPSLNSNANSSPNAPSRVWPPPGPAAATVDEPYRMTAAKLRLAMASMGKPGTKIAELCSEVGVTRQTLYRHVSPTGELRPDGMKLLSR